MAKADHHTCRLCRGSENKIFIQNIKTAHNDSFMLKICKNCSFISIFPIPTKKTLREYYDQNYWQAGEKRSSSFLSHLYKWRMINIVTSIRKRCQPPGKILDWGCGDGAFIKLLRAYGYDCYGIDAYNEEINSPYIRNATINDTDFPDKFFDIITCFHVLEHLPDPLDSVVDAMKLLKTGGLMIVEVPNITSLGFRIFKKRWQPLEIPTHLNHFSPQTLRKLFAAAGRTKIIKEDFFSNRISPSAFVLSAFPGLTPKSIRLKYRGRYPLALSGIYFLLQLLAYPVAIAGSLTQNGEIVRMTVRKSS